MIKKILFLLLIICLVLPLASPAPVQAQGGLAIVASSAKAEFPLKLHFNLTARSDVNITDARLHYDVDRGSYARVTSEVYLEFAPAASVDISWTWDTRRTGGLPPGSTVRYWWTVADEKGRRVENAPVTVPFDDNRYPWQRLTAGELTIYWYRGDKSFAEELMLAAQRALARLAADTGAYLEKPARIYIYGSARDLQGSLIFPTEWTGGVAFTRHGSIAIGISPASVDWGKRAIVHELTHLVVHQMTFNPYNDLPTWLNEGLSMYAEGELEAAYVDLLKRAVAEKGLISVRSLSSPFSAFPGSATLSYAQSFSLVEYLVRSYGQAKMLGLLTAFRQGSGYDDALVKVYGFDMDGLNTRWRDYVARQYQGGRVTARPALVAAGGR